MNQVAPTQMTVKEASEKKRAMQAAITEMLTTFTREAGVKIESIYVQRIFMGDRTMKYNVEVEAHL